MAKLHHSICPACGDDKVYFQTDYMNQNSNQNNSHNTISFSSFVDKIFNKISKSRNVYTVGHCCNCGHTWRTLDENVSFLEILMWALMLICLLGVIIVWKILHWYFSTDKIFMSTNGRIFLLCGIALSVAVIFGIVVAVTKPY